MKRETATKKEKEKLILKNPASLSFPEPGSCNEMLNSLSYILTINKS